MPTSRIPPAALLLLGLLSLGWGINWPVMKIVITDIPRWIFRGDSILLASIGLFAIAAASGRSLRVPQGRLGQLLAMAACNIAGWNMLAIYGVSLLPSGRAAILGYTMPIWSALLSVWLLNEPLTRRRLAGLALGMAGMVLLLGTEIATLRAAPLGVAFMVAAAISWAAGLVIYKRNPIPMPMASLTAWQMLLGGIPVAIAGHVVEQVSLGQIGSGPWLGFWYNVFVALLFCYWAWNSLVDMVPASVSALGSLIVPVVGVFSGMLILGETPGWQDYAALVLVLGAIATVVIPQPQRA